MRRAAGEHGGKQYSKQHFTVGGRARAEKIRKAQTGQMNELHNCNRTKSAVVVLCIPTRRYREGRAALAQRWIRGGGDHGIGCVHL